MLAAKDSDLAALINASLLGGRDKKGRISAFDDVIGDLQERGVFDRLLVMGGKEDCGADSKANRAVAAVLRDGSLHCSATLIGTRTVLTAAHCIKGVAEDRLSIFFGCNVRVPRTGTRHAVAAAWADARFNGKAPDHDIGVICMKDPPDESIEPLPIPSRVLDDAVYRASSILFVGFGYADVSARQRTGIRRKVEMKVDAVNAASFTYGNSVRNTCYGDSGGPAFASDLLVGVTSSGDERCRKDGVDARVDKSLDFIANRREACSAL